MITAEPTVCDDIAILIIGCAAWMNRDLQRVADFLDAQLRAVLAAVPRVPRLDREARRRLAELANRIERARLEACARIVTVDTLRRWFRTLVARKWTHPRTGPGRPPIAPDTEQQIVTMARENPGWGVRGISQRLRLLGIAVSRATVRRVLRRNAIDPAPMRATQPYAQAASRHDPATRARSASAQRAVWADSDWSASRSAASNRWTSRSPRMPLYRSGYREARRARSACAAARLAPSTSPSARQQVAK